MPGHRLTLRVLGAPVISGPDGALSGRATYRRRLALLALLAAARGRPVGRERIVGLLWSEHPPAAARRILSEALYVFRRELGEDALVAIGDEVALNPAVVRSDIDAFQEALEAGDPERAVEAYGGPLLEGFFVDGAPEFERWVDAERHRLGRSYARALEELAEAEEGAGRAVRAVEWWRRLAAADPFSSRAVLRLARALEEAGDRPSALRAAEAHAVLLREELGVAPDPALADLVARLRVEPPPPAAPPSPPAAPRSARSEPEPPAPRGPPPPGRPRRRHRRWVLLPAAVAGVALGVALRLPPTRGDLSVPASGYDPRRIAVTYFEDLSPGGELGYLAGGLTAMLIHELSQVPALDVISRGGVRPYRDRAVPFDSMVARLRVGSVVEGSVQRSRDSVFVTVVLVDGASGAQLESRILGRPAGEVMDLQRALGDEVAASLRRRLGREIRLVQVRGEARSPRAAELVLRAEQLREDAGSLAARRLGPDAASSAALLLRADSLLDAAEREDPQWVRPPVLRGRVALARAAARNGPERRALLEEAAGHARRALEREPGNGAALELRGTAAFRAAVEAGDTASAGRMEAAESDLRSALAVEPARATAWSTLSLLLRVRGRFAESDLAARRALAEDAYLDDAAAIRQRLVFGAMAAGDYPRAAEECARGHAQFPGEWRFVECRLTLLRQDTAGPADPALAWRLVAELDRLDPPERARAEQRTYSPLYRRMVAAAVSARAGDRDSARAVLARARAEVGDSSELAVSLDYDEAYLRLLLGEREAARVLLGRVWAARPWLRTYLRRDPLLREVIRTIPDPAAASPDPPGSTAWAPRPDRSPRP